MITRYQKTETTTNRVGERAMEEEATTAGGGEVEEGKWLGQEREEKRASKAPRKDKQRFQ